MGYVSCQKGKPLEVIFSQILRFIHFQPKILQPTSMMCSIFLEDLHALKQHVLFFLTVYEIGYFGLFHLIQNMDLQLFKRGGALPTSRSFPDTSQSTRDMKLFPQPQIALNGNLRAPPPQCQPLPPKEIRPY